MRLRVGLVALALVGAAVSALAAPTRAQPYRPSIRWLAAGDSFSSGEGLPAVEPYSGTVDCQRAIGTADHPSIAWAPLAKRTLEGMANRPFDIGTFAFVACTGAITDDFFFGREEPPGLTLGGEEYQGQWEQGSEATYDLVTFSFGGNNIGFADILTDCVDLPWNLDDRAIGCAITSEEMAGRITALVTSDGNLYRGEETLPELYDMVAQVVSPGGHVVVMGYPGLVEAFERWSLGNWLFGTCHRLLSIDVPLLRDLATLLDGSIREAVQEAGQRHPEITFTYISALDLFESSDASADRHALCGPGGEWLNGIAASGEGGWRWERSFHPNQLGQNAMAGALVEILVGLDWSQLGEQAEFADLAGAVVEDPLWGHGERNMWWQNGDEATGVLVSSESIMGGEPGMNLLALSEAEGVAVVGLGRGQVLTEAWVDRYEGDIVPNGYAIFHRDEGRDVWVTDVAITSHLLGVALAEVPELGPSLSGINSMVSMDNLVIDLIGGQPTFTAAVTVVDYFQRSGPITADVACVVGETVTCETDTVLPPAALRDAVIRAIDDRSEDALRRLLSPEAFDAIAEMALSPVARAMGHPDDDCVASNGTARCDIFMDIAGAAAIGLDLELVRGQGWQVVAAEIWWALSE